MRSTVSLSDGGGRAGSLRARVGRMKRLFRVRTPCRVDALADVDPGVWLRSFQLLDTECQAEVSGAGVMAIHKAR
ncbi:hypothetical protein DPEC_G00172610 [Dallia pectoralis]|uniref:Uncharacterized protein n=1 Tax=Dallia pectoralis TaxID=75939 RepID=A0ACC2GDS0_DALPE|nr:hypothetical protein DPEC_G00172610 [Dallia pectoralis]